MSQIYAPGSIAGPQGPAGPAGSAAAITSLATALLPSFVGVNLFDKTRITPAHQVSAADGTLAANGSVDAGGLIFCPGATSMVSNLAIDAGDWGGGVCLYDANGTFISVLPTAGMTLANNNTIIGYKSFALPGTQTYVRFGYIPSWAGSNNWITADSGMVYATLTGSAALPGSYAPYGLTFDTTVDVNAKDAAVASNAAAAVTTVTQNIGAGLGLFAHAMLPSPDGCGRNALDVRKVLANVVIGADGAQHPLAGWSSAIVFAPGATQFITNLPIRAQNLSGSIFSGICTYDAFGSFIAEISSADGISALLLPNNVYALPGNQTYVGFTWNAGNYGWGPEPNGAYFSPSDAAAMFLVGNATTPCPASLPQGVPASGSPCANVKTATQLGAANDASADCASLLNAFLATASATNPVKLILDGRFSLSTSLVLSPSGYTTVEGIGWGSGLTMTGGSGSIVIGANGQGAYNVAAPARTATNIALRNFTVLQAGATPAAMILTSCSNVVVENVNFTAAMASNDFMLTIGNANQVFVRGCSFASSGTSHDGVHIDGKCEDITISDCSFATGDDAIALNAPEGYGGDISRVTVTNCLFNGSLTVMRVYTSLDAAAMPANNVHKVRGVVVSNCTGFVTSVCFNLGITNGGLSATTDVDQLQDLSISNCTLSSPQGLALLLTPIGSLTFSDVKFIPTSTAPVISAMFSSVGELELSGVRVLRNADGNAAPASILYLYSGVALDRVSLVDFAVVDQEGSSYAPIPALADVNGTIAAMRLESIDLTHITALTSSAGWTGVSALRGGGVLATGAQVPDSVMDSNAPYLSSTAGGAPSIKVGGVAKRFTLA